MRNQLAKLDLLILDELGYVPTSKLGAELLFDVISTAYERTSLVVTTNPPFENWTEVLGSERLTGATLDRLTRRCHILEATGESYRPQDARRRQQRETAPTRNRTQEMGKSNLSSTPRNRNLLLWNELRARDLGVAPGAVVGGGIDGHGQGASTCWTVGGSATPAAANTLPQVPWASLRNKNRLPSCSTSAYCRLTKSRITSSHSSL